MAFRVKIKSSVRISSDKFQLNLKKGDSILNCTTDVDPNGLTLFILREGKIFREYYYSKPSKNPIFGLKESEELLELTTAIMGIAEKYSTFGPPIKIIPLLASYFLVVHKIGMGYLLDLAKEKNKISDLLIIRPDELQLFKNKITVEKWNENFFDFKIDQTSSLTFHNEFLGISAIEVSKPKEENLELEEVTILFINTDGYIVSFSLTILSSGKVFVQKIYIKTKSGSTYLIKEKLIINNRGEMIFPKITREKVIPKYEKNYYEELNDPLILDYNVFYDPSKWAEKVFFKKNAITAIHSLDKDREEKHPSFIIAAEEGEIFFLELFKTKERKKYHQKKIAEVKPLKIIGFFEKGDCLIALSETGQYLLLKINTPSYKVLKIKSLDKEPEHALKKLTKKISNTPDIESININKLLNKLFGEKDWEIARRFLDNLVEKLFEKGLAELVIDTSLCKCFSPRDRRQIKASVIERILVQLDKGKLKKLRSNIKNLLKKIKNLEGENSQYSKIRAQLMEILKAILILNKKSPIPKKKLKKLNQELKKIEEKIQRSKSLPEYRSPKKTLIRPAISLPEPLPTVESTEIFKRGRHPFFSTKKFKETETTEEDKSLKSSNCAASNITTDKSDSEEFSFSLDPDLDPNGSEEEALKPGDLSLSNFEEFKPPETKIGF
ncbi:MAG: hypothetical protein JW855_02125 [Gammaproteobacteria bacterium]|nr:hypothetical protein [Gammaproteobacteria bacterium]